MSEQTRLKLTLCNPQERLDFSVRCYTLGFNTAKTHISSDKYVEDPDAIIKESVELFSATEHWVEWVVIEEDPTLCDSALDLYSSAFASGYEDAGKQAKGQSIGS